MKTLALALVVACLILGGCRVPVPLGSTAPAVAYPYPRELRDNDGNPIQPPAWTNNPGSWTNGTNALIYSPPSGTVTP